jgi:hypothetical protein
VGCITRVPKGDGIINALAQLPQQVRTKWHIALKSAQFRRRIIEELDLSSALESLERLVTLSRQIKLACLEETRAVCFGLDEDRLSIVAADRSFEICKLDFADQSHFFRSEAELWNRMIYAEKVETISGERDFRSSRLTARISPL